VRNQLLALVLLLSIALVLALVTLGGAILLVATPLVLYMIASWIWAPPEPRLEAMRSLSRDRANPDEPIDVTITVRNTGAALLEMVIRDAVPRGMNITAGSPQVATSLPADSECTFTYTVTGSRGSYEFDTLSVSFAGLFALRARTVSFRQEQELVMLPNHRALARIPIAPRRTLVFAGTNPARTGGEGTEFFDIREHRGSQSVRHVNWRATARFEDRVFVNEFEQERVADVAIMLDCRLRAYPGSGDRRELFDAAASAAASLTDVILDAGNRVGYLGYGLSLDWLGPGFGRIQKHRVLNRIAKAYPGESHVFSTFEALPERLFPAGSQVIVVSPLLPDDVPTIERLLAYGYAVMVVTPDPIPSQTPASLDPAGREALRLVTLERAVLLRRLRHAGIAVIDWNPAESLEQAVGRSMGAILAAWRTRRP
jgi:uncharacterized repeat protein (TIGR01451 family)